MKKAAVFGLGHFGASAAAALHAEGVEVLAVDSDRHLVDEIKDRVSVAVAFDATIRRNLEKFDVGGMDVVIVGMGTDFEASVMVTLLCRELGVRRIVCKALSKRQRDVLLKVGADDVMMPEEQMGQWLAMNLIHGSVVNLVDLPEGFSILSVEAPESWCGRSLAELELPDRERLILVQVHRAGADGTDEKTPLPAGDFRIEPGDALDIIGSDERLKKFKTVDPV